MAENYIPFEIQEEIMKKLPLTSLIRFRSVSKAWKSLISFKFLAKLENVSQPRCQFISYNNYYHTFDDETFPQCNFTSNPTMGQEYSTTPLRELIPQGECPYSLERSTLVGSSHGLLCFSDSERSKVIMWNPSIKKSIAIEVPCRPKPFHGFPTVVGFGVCPLTLDPKIIIIPRIQKRCYSCLLSIVEVKVFSLSSCTWRRPSINLPRQNMTLENSHVVIDGFNYWLASDYTNTGRPPFCTYLIISFDLTKEEFREIHLPESIKFESLSISKLRETLVVLENSKIQLCAVWMLDNDSFTRLYTIDAPGTSFARILGFRNTGAILFKRKGAIATYEPDSKQITHIGDSRCPVSVHSYMESLLLIDQPDGSIYRDCKAKTIRKRKVGSYSRSYKKGRNT